MRDKRTRQDLINLLNDERAHKEGALIMAKELQETKTILLNKYNKEMEMVNDLREQILGLQEENKTLSEEQRKWEARLSVARERHEILERSLKGQAFALGLVAKMVEGPY